MKTVETSYCISMEHINICERLHHVTGESAEYIALWAHSVLIETRCIPLESLEEMIQAWINIKLAE